MTNKTTKAEHSKKVFVWVSVVCFIVAMVVTFIPKASTFDLMTTTEVFEFVSSRDHQNIWYLASAQIENDGALSPQLFTGRVIIGDNVQVRIQRISGGPLNITLVPVEAKKQSPASLSREDGTSVLSLGHKITFSLKDLPARASSGQSVVLPISGDPRVGATVGIPSSEYSPLLRQGQISVIGRNFLGSDLYRGTSQVIEPGDVVLFEKPNGPALGILTIDERPAMTATVHVLAREALIQRAPASGFTVGLTFLDRLQKDGTLQGIWGAFIFLYGLRKLGESS